jgi:hypothetical protein
MAAEERLDLGALKRFTEDATPTGEDGLWRRALQVVLGIMGAVIVWFGIDWIGDRLTIAAQEFRSSGVEWRILAMTMIGVVTAILSRHTLSLFAGSLLLLAGMIVGGFWTSEVLFESMVGTDLGVFLLQGAHNGVINVCFAIWLSLGVTRLLAGRRRRRPGRGLDRVGDGV